LLNTSIPDRELEPRPIKKNHEANAIKKMMGNIYMLSIPNL